MFAHFLSSVVEEAETVTLNVPGSVMHLRCASGGTAPRAGPTWVEPLVAHCWSSVPLRWHEGMPLAPEGQVFSFSSFVELDILQVPGEK